MALSDRTAGSNRTSPSDGASPSHRTAPSDRSGAPFGTRPSSETSATISTGVPAVRAPVALATRPDPSDRTARTHGLTGTARANPAPGRARGGVARPSPDLVVKLYDPRGASPLFPNDIEAEVRALAALAGSGLAPRLVARGAGWICYAHVAGRSWSGDPRPVAGALARLHARRLPAGTFRPRASGSAALRAEGVAMAPGVSPPDAVEAGPAPAVPIHCDAVPGNIVVGEAGITLIDWQCPATGDAAEDLALFLSPAMQWLYRGAVLDAGAARAFLDASPPAHAARYRALAPLFRWRMAAHCAWRARRGDPGYAEALGIELAAPGADA